MPAPPDVPAASDLVRRVAAEWLGLELDASEAEALARARAPTARGLAAFPDDELQGVEPPLRPAAAP